MTETLEQIADEALGLARVLLMLTPAGPPTTQQRCAAFEAAETALMLAKKEHLPIEVREDAADVFEQCMEIFNRGRHDD